MNGPSPLPARLQPDLARAIRLEWITIATLASAAIVIALVMGESRAMRTALWEDLLSMLPPVAFLVAVHLERRPPSRRFPYGFLGSPMIGFLCAACALLGVGAMLLIEAVRDLATHHRPSIGAMSVGGHVAWSGWWMLGAIAYSLLPPILLGRLKRPLARRLHDDTLATDADMNRADWQTGAAAGLGVFGVGAGFWWADAAAAGAISLLVLADGARNLRLAVRKLVDQAPTDIDGKPFGIEERVIAVLRQLSWIEDARVRLREEGRFIFGEACLLVRRGVDPSPERLTEARKLVLAQHWRIFDIAWALQTSGPCDACSAMPTDADARAEPVRRKGSLVKERR